ncbi:MAG: CHRD domain-containing protein [Pseudomonadota bacterium]
MNKFIILTAATLASLSAMSVDARTNRFETDLSGAEEVINTNVSGTVIPVIGLVTGAYGEAFITVSKDRSTINYRLKVSNTATPIFMAHIHLGPKGQNGPVMLWLFGDSSNNPAGTPLPRDDGPFTGEISGTLTAANLVPQPNLGINTFEDAIANLLRGNTYVNVHTRANPPGEVRGQIDEHSHFNF